MPVPRRGLARRSRQAMIRFACWRGATGFRRRRCGAVGRVAARRIVRTHGTIAHFLDVSGLRRHLAPFYSHTGCLSVRTELMTRMLVIGYAYGIHSERRLCDPGWARWRRRLCGRCKRRGALPARRSPGPTRRSIRGLRANISLPLIARRNWPGADQADLSDQSFGALQK